MQQLLIIILFFSINLNGQKDGFDLYLLVKAEEAGIYKEPSLNSKKVKTIQKNELVKIIDLRRKDQYTDIIDGVRISWAIVEHEETKGYLFRGYLGREEVYMPNQDWEGKYLLLSTGHQAGAEYSEDLNWYGIFPRKDGEYIERVQIGLEFSVDSIMGDNLKISTNRDENERMIIGTNEEIQTGRVSIPLGSIYDGLTLMNYQAVSTPIYRDDCSVNTDYFLAGWSAKQENNPCYSEGYNIGFYKQHLKKQKQRLHTFQGLVETLGDCNVPHLYWFGDINGDGIPDFIFYSPATYFAKYKLYLSEKEEGKVRFEKVTDYIPWFTPC